METSQKPKRRTVKRRQNSRPPTTMPPRTKPQTKKETKNELEECEICYSLIRLPPIECPQCHVRACVECVKSWILSTPLQVPHCMKCKRHFDHEFLTKTPIPKTWLNRDFRKHQTKVVVEAEKQALPVILEKMKLEEEAAKDETKRNELLRKRDNIEWKIMELENKIGFFDEENAAEIIREINEKLRGLYAERRTSEENLLQFRTTTTTTKKKKGEFKFIVNCPMENCRGFLSAKYECGICGIHVCPACREVKKDENHQCDPEILKNVQQIKYETKSCPKCGVPIHKIDGCDDMWCWACHTPFNYGTGEIVKSNTNPHFWAWKKSIGEGILDDSSPHIPPALLVPQNQLLNIVFPNTRITVKNVVYTAALTPYIMRQYDDTRIQDIFEKNHRLYLEGKINKQEWERRVFLAYRTKSRNQELYQVFDTLREGLISILSRVEFDARMTGKINEMFSVEIMNLREYMNEIFQSIKSRYNMAKRIDITEKWKLDM